MNVYEFFVPSTGVITSEQANKAVQAFVIGSAMSPNFDVFRPYVSTSDTEDKTPKLFLRFTLPFSLSNLGLDEFNPEFAMGLIESQYDTRFRDVKEFLDKPYAVAGRIACFIVTPDVSVDWRKDMDEYQKIDFYDVSQRISYSLVMGTVNSTLTESYQPLGIVGSQLPEGMLACKFYEPADLRAGVIQAVNTVRVQQNTRLSAVASPSLTATAPSSPQSPYLSINSL